MHRFRSPSDLVRCFAVALFVLAAFVVPAPSVRAATTDNVTGWAWSGTIGWISLNCVNNVGECADSNYGVTLTDKVGAAGTASISGYAWSDTAGWICWGAACTGTTPEGGPAYAEYRAMHAGKADQLWGWAKVVSWGDLGWIALNCDKDVGADECGTSDFKVVLDNATGNFTKGAANDHWAWGANDVGAGVGWVDLSAASTGWVLAKIGRVIRPQGVFEPQNVGLSGTHLSTFSIKFPDLRAGTGQYLECAIALPDGSKRVLARTFSAPVRSQAAPPTGPTSLQYTVQNADALDRDRLWYVEVCRIAGPEKATVCAADAACGANAICDEVAGNCRDVVATSNAPRPIYTHENVWTGTFGAGDDQYRAIRCNAGFPGSYFTNAVQCDFAGDASFALAMRRGVPVEGNCEDLIDNDGNGQVDCADRYCKGVSYLCQALARASCVRGVSDAVDQMPDCGVGVGGAGLLCCSAQPMSAGSSQNHVVDGICAYGDENDGYFDCDCQGAAIGASPGCYAPGHQAGNACCSADNEVVIQ